MESRVQVSRDKNTDDMRASRNYLKVIWYLKNLFNLLKVIIRTLIYCIFHPKTLGKLSFSLFSTLNEFYQFTHSRLYDFRKTSLYQNLTNTMIFGKCNYFNLDYQVMRHAELQILANLIKCTKPKKIFEIGTYTGFTTLHFALNAPDDAKVYTLDLPPDYNLKEQNQNEQKKYSYDDLLVVELSVKNINNRLFKSQLEQSKITELFGDSKKFDFAPYFGKMDVIFIDGNHSYEYVKSDTENALKMVSPNGVIVWHDFDYIIHRDVFKYLNDLVDQYKICSIPNTRFAIYSPSFESNLSSEEKVNR